MVKVLQVVMVWVSSIARRCRRGEDRTVLEEGQVRPGADIVDSDEPFGMEIPGALWEGEPGGTIARDKKPRKIATLLLGTFRGLA